MIATISVKCSAHNSEQNLDSLYSYIGSLMTVRVVDVPKKIGNWNIENVYFTFNNGNEILSKQCVKSGSIYSVTVDGVNVVSDTWYRISADGIDEDGNYVSEYILGQGDLHFIDADSTITIGETTYYLHLKDNAENPKKGDVAVIDGIIKLYDGSEWLKFGDECKVQSVNGQTGNVTITANDLSVYTKAQTDANVKVVSDRVDVIDSYIPSAATESNKLTDTNFVNSSIATNTANFRGTFDSESELPTEGMTNNDYAFVIGKDSEGNTEYRRYKYSGTSWEYEYTLNNSSFTANQWATINSGATKDKIDSIDDKLGKTEPASGLTDTAYNTIMGTKDSTGLD